MSDVSEADIARVVAGDASPAERARVMAHVRLDPKAQRTFRTLVDAERLLAGGPADVPSSTELDALLPSILEAAAAKEPAWSRARGIWAALPALGAVAAVAMFVVLPSLRGADSGARDDEFKPRGAASSSVKHIPVELFCVDKSGAPRALRAGHRTCAAGASVVLTFAGSARGDVCRVEYVDAGEARHRYPDAVLPADSTYSTSIDLGASEPRGHARIHVELYSPGVHRTVMSDDFDLDVVDP